MGKPRVLILTNRVPYPLTDGGALAMNAMLEGYHNQRWELLLFAMNTSRHYVSKETLPDLYNEIQFETFDINTDVKLLPTLKNFFLSRKPNHVERFYDKDYVKRLERIISNFAPDIIQIESIYLASYVPALRALTNIQIAIRLHNIEYQIWERLASEATSSFKRYYLKDLAARIKKFELSAWSQADILIPITNSDAELVKQSTSHPKFVVAPFGIDLKKVPTQPVVEKWVGFHLGAMDWLPNVEAITWFLEDVWPRLHRAVPEFKFYFAGRNMPGSFEKYESDSIFCEGEVASAQAFISDKKILIVPIRSGGGIRIKILEAMAAGKLVVSTSVGMQGIDDARPGIHFLSAETEEDFTDQVKWLVSHRGEAEEIARTGAALILDKYDQNKIMSRLITELAESIES